MTASELISLISSVASLVLAVLAITLSIVFFRMSTVLSQSANDAAKGIEASVARLEQLFDKLYSDTFSMMRETVSDMRKHMWPEEVADMSKLGEEAERLAEKKVAKLKALMQTIEAHDRLDPEDNRR